MSGQKLSENPPKWITLTEIAEIENVKTASFQQPVVVFKHSTTCPVSGGAYRRFNQQWDSESPTPLYYVDVRASRPVSQAIAATFGIPHESPQILVLKNGECIYDESHYGISAEAVAALPDLP